MSPSTWEDTPHLGAESRYGPTPVVGRAGWPPPATVPPVQEQLWPPTPDPGDRPHAPLPGSHTAPLDPSGTSTNALIALPEVLTAREAAAILRIGRNQAYQAIARGELGAIRIGRSIHIPKQALLDLLASTGPPTASSDEQPRQPATQMREEPSQDSR
jgi:excisionase family DNA binding protein